MRKIIMAVLMGVLLGSYASASDQNSIKQVQSLIKDQTGYKTSLTYENKRDDTDSTIEGLLSLPLTEEAAVKISLFNNSSVKAAIASLGISQADMREMGILHNPTVRFSSRSSNQEGSKRNNEIEIKEDVLDLLFWPLRTRLGNTQFKISQYQAAQKITDFVKEVRLAYFQWLAAMNKRSLIEDYYQAEESAMTIAQRQKDAGNINILQLDRHKLMLQKVNIERLRASQMSEESLQRLRTMLGLNNDQFIMEKTKELPNLPEETLNLSDLEKGVLSNRLDLMMESQEIKAFEENMTLTGFGALPGLEVGYDQEREASGDKLKGIVVEGQVPLFSRNQAQYSGVQAHIATAKYQLKAMEEEALLQVRLAYKNVMTNREIVHSYMESIPVHQEMIKETLYHYNFMLKGVFDILDIKQQELDARKEYIDALHDYWASRVELEYALGKQIPFKEAVMPVQKPNETKTMEHEHHGG